MTTTERGSALRQRHADLLQQQPNTRARNAAQALGVSEGELLASQVGAAVAVLRHDPQALLSRLEACGEVMALTRNANCVHERHGVYTNLSFSRHGPMHMGLAVNEDIDLRMFLNQWQFSFAVTESGEHGERRSLQFFDRYGEAVHKVYFTEQSNLPAWRQLLDDFHDPALQTDTIDVEPLPAPAVERADADIDRAALERDWRALEDTHDFFPLLKKHDVQRLQALRLVPRDLAYPVAAGAAREALNSAKELDCPVMVFVGNRGCIQIHTGPVENLRPTGPWFNVLDPKFNLHLLETGIAQCWVTRKPSRDGIVTALEVFDAQGELIVQLFGKRKPGIEELPLWRAIVSSLSARESEARQVAAVE